MRPQNKKFYLGSSPLLIYKVDKLWILHNMKNEKQINEKLQSYKDKNYYQNKLSHNKQQGGLGGAGGTKGIIFGNA